MRIACRCLDLSIIIASNRCKPNLDIGIYSYKAKLCAVAYQQTCKSLCSTSMGLSANICHPSSTPGDTDQVRENKGVIRRRPLTPEAKAIREGEQFCDVSI